MQTFAEWMEKKESFEPERPFEDLDISGQKMLYSHPTREENGVEIKVMDNDLILKKMDSGISGYVRRMFGRHEDGSKVEMLAKKYAKALRDYFPKLSKISEDEWKLSFANNERAQRAFVKTDSI